MEEIKQYKLANKNLSEKLSKVSDERDTLWMANDTLQKQNINLSKAIQNKMRVARIVVKYDDMNLVLQILKSQQTPEGLFITGRI